MASTCRTIWYSLLSKVDGCSIWQEWEESTIAIIWLLTVGKVLYTTTSVMVVSRAGVPLRDDTKELCPEESMQPVPTLMGKPSAHRARVPKHHEDSPVDLATWPWNGPVMERATNLSWRR